MPANIRQANAPSGPGEKDPYPAAPVSLMHKSRNGSELPHLLSELLKIIRKADYIDILEAHTAFLLIQRVFQQQRGHAPVRRSWLSCLVCGRGVVQGASDHHPMLPHRSLHEHHPGALRAAECDAHRLGLGSGEHGHLIQHSGADWHRLHHSQPLCWATPCRNLRMGLPAGTDVMSCGRSVCGTTGQALPVLADIHALRLLREPGHPLHHAAHHPCAVLLQVSQAAALMLHFHMSPFGYYFQLDVMMASHFYS